MKRLVIYGTGGNGRGMLEVAEAINDIAPTWDIVGFLNDDPAVIGSTVCDYPIVGGYEWLLQHKDVWLVLGIGNTADRYKVAASLEQDGVSNFATLIHPSAVLARRFAYGVGCVIFGNVTVDVDTRIGDHVQLGRNSSLGHDISVGSFVNLSPAATMTGFCVVGDGCDIGANATVIPRVGIDEWSIIGAGSVVTKPIPANVTAVGTPAKAVKNREPGWQLS